MDQTEGNQLEVKTNKKYWPKNRILGKYLKSFFYEHLICSRLHIVWQELVLMPSYFIDLIDHVHN